ncbi:hypothetical protein ACFFX1_55385 [Dactylosporangium sucinum]|uniref:Uncharacterized protein n=1 Tax=Dactylosporangium sucinum TaxID=1424081 RepID=A0A917U2D3_9ACTN|nr:hypothetical protein [Dactylosporangium sucinum]GGM52729.1 hypothetical protein GCM10007977_062870 [Dactylosporangium sucinum]
MTTADLAGYGYAILDNLGEPGWDLRIRTGQTVHHVQFGLRDLADDESPRDRAAREIGALGWKVAGDGSWWVSAWDGPGASTTTAGIVPADTNPNPENRS